MRFLVAVSVSLAACALLQADDQRLVLQLSSGIHAERANAAYLLGMSDDPGISGLLLHQLRDEPVRDNKLIIIESLKKLDTNEGYKGLSAHYQSEQDIIVRRKIVQVLGQSGDRQYIPLIAKTLELPGTRDQQLALAALSRINDPEAAKVLFSYYGSKRSHSEKERALAAIAVQRRVESVKPLIYYGQRTKDPSERVRIAETLSDIGDSQAQDAIYQWFQESEDKTSKKRLIASLKNVGTSKMVGTLSKELSTNDLYLQMDIVNVMVAIDEQAAQPYLRSYYEKSMMNLQPETSRLEAVKVIRLHNELRQLLSIEENFFDKYPEQWKNDPVISRMIAS